MEKPMSRICWASLAESSGNEGFVGGGFRSGMGGGTGDGGFVVGAEGGCSSETGSVNMGGGGGVQTGSGCVSSEAEAAADGVSREVELADLLVSPSPIKVYPFKLLDVEVLSSAPSTPRLLLVPDLDILFTESLTDGDSLNIGE